MRRRTVFGGNFTEQEQIPQGATEAIFGLLRSGKLHRYSPGNTADSQAAMLEREFRDWQGSDYCLAVTSCGQALQIALRAAGVRPGDRVLMNAFTLAPVPGAVAAVGARPILVEINDQLVIDLDDLVTKARRSDAKYLLVSHMRGHLCDMDELAKIASGEGLTLIEDCAHTMGARWNGVRSGNFGKAACFSTQSYKHMNSGEGGLITSSDPELMARATILSGSYMLYDRHGAGPPAQAFAKVMLETPNMSARLDEIRSAMLRAQIPLIDSRIARWASLHAAMASALRRAHGVVIPERSPKEFMAASSLQFRLPNFSPSDCSRLVESCAKRGVVLKWFGATEPAGYTSAHSSWAYVAAQSLPHTDLVLSTLFDIRLSPTFAPEDCQCCAQIIFEEVADLAA